MSVSKRFDGVMMKVVFAFSERPSFKLPKPVPIFFQLYFSPLPPAATSLFYK